MSHVSIRVVVPLSSNEEVCTCIMHMCVNIYAHTYLQSYILYIYMYVSTYIHIIYICIHICTHIGLSVLTVFEARVENA